MEIVPAWDHLPEHLSWKQKVCLLTYCSLSHLEQKETPLAHIFEPGVYIREMRIPAGVLLTGREHLLGHKVELMEGSAILFAPDGKHRFDAYAFIHTRPGFHAVAYTLTDVVSRTVHPNAQESRDIEALENHWFGPAMPVVEAGKRLFEEIQCQQLSAPLAH
jgi:hypothetical protein